MRLHACVGESLKSCTPFDKNPKNPNCYDVPLPDALYREFGHGRSLL